MFFAAAIAFGSFSGFGEVYRDIEIPILCLCDPLQILTDAVTADIVGILTQFIEITGRILRGLFILPVELSLRPRSGAASGSS